MFLAPRLYSAQGVTDVLCEACASLNWKWPTAIQRESLPVALQGELKLVCRSHHLPDMAYLCREGYHWIG